MTLSTKLIKIAMTIRWSTGATCSNKSITLAGPYVF